MQLQNRTYLRGRINFHQFQRFVSSPYSPKPFANGVGMRYWTINHSDVTKIKLNLHTNYSIDARGKRFFFSYHQWRVCIDADVNGRENLIINDYPFLDKIRSTSWFRRKANWITTNFNSKKSECRQWRWDVYRCWALFDRATFAAARIK